MVIVLSDTSDIEILNPHPDDPSLSNNNAPQDDVAIIELSITDDSSDAIESKENNEVKYNESGFLSDHETYRTPSSKRKLKNVINNTPELFLKSSEEHIPKLSIKDKERLFLDSNNEISEDNKEIHENNSIEPDLNKQVEFSNKNSDLRLSDDSVFGDNIASPIKKMKKSNAEEVVVVELSDSSDEEITASNKITNAKVNNKKEPSNNANNASNLVDDFFDDVGISQGNQTENSIMLKVLEVISDVEDVADDNNVLASENVSANNKISDWEIKPHVDYLATIQITASDLDLQLREIHRSKLAKQRFTHANKVNRLFKQDIVENELMMISNMDLTMKNNQQDCFYIQNGDLLIRKREESYLKRDIKELSKLIPDLKYATFTRRLTSVYELNSDMFIPIKDLIKINNKLNNNENKIDFVDVDMSESLFLLNIQRLYEIFHFKEYSNVKKKFETYLLNNKKISLILIGFNKFKMKLVKWENSQQLQQYQSLHNTTTRKSKKTLIPEEYQNCSLKDVNEFILRLQMTYPTHLHCKIIETEVIFINDWMLNYLKTILRRRYAEKKEKLLYKSRTTTSSNNPFENFLLSLSGITQNNVSQISASLGGSYQNLERNIDDMRG
ncbi:hypothetical protein ACO0R3_000518 [Hanseniaspora guilliermondii]